VKPPDSAEVFETSISSYWIADGVVYINSKKAENPDLETIRKEIAEFKKRLPGRKLCAVVDVGGGTTTSAKIRDYNSSQLPDLFKAMALIIRNPFSRMAATIFIGVSPVSFPTKMCSSEKEADDWIKKYI